MKEILNSPIGRIFTLRTLPKQYYIFGTAISLFILASAIPYLAPSSKLSGNEASKTESTILALDCTNKISGTVFMDFDFNGDINNNDSGLSGIIVSAFNSENILVGSATSDALGEYTISETSIDENYRVELDLSTIPAGLKSGPSGNSSHGPIRIVSPGDCINFGVVDPNSCDESLVAAVCFARNNDPTSEPTIVFVNTDDARDFPGPANNNDNNGLWGIPSGSNSANYPLTFLEAANAGEVNTTFGMDFDVDNSRLITGSYMRAYSPMNTNGSANGYAEAALYQIPMDLATEVANPPSVWLDLEDLFGDDVAGTYLPDAVYPGPAVYGRSGSNPDLIGYTGLGSIKISSDRSELYVVNLDKRSVYVIPIGPNGEAPTSSSDIKEFELPNTNCNGSWPDGRDLRAALGLGIHPESGRVYATLTCTGPTYDDVTGYVYSFDPSDMSPASSDFDLELTVPLNIARPATSPNTGAFWGQIGKPWESVPANSVFYLNDPRTGGNLFNPLPNEKNTQHNQPWLAEVEFGRKSDGAYSMIIGERNRYHDIISSSFYVAGGVIFRACGSEGSWTLSNGNSCGSDMSTVNFSFTGNNAGVYTNEENRYMMYVGREGSMGSGMLATPQGTPYVVSPVMDNLFNSATSGLTWLNFEDGSREKDIRILGNYSGGGFNNTNFTKANNWGAIAAMCIPKPIEVGNFVWLDTNANGIQDAGEEGIANVSITLCDESGTTVYGTTTTDPSGYYYFNEDNVNQNGATGINANTNYKIKVENISGISQQIALENLKLTDTESGDNKEIDNNAMVDGLNGMLSFSVDEYGCNDHSLDIGFKQYISCSVLSEDPLCFGESNGTITISAETDDGDDLEYSINGSDYFPTDVFMMLASGSYDVRVRLSENTEVEIICNNNLILSDPLEIQIEATVSNIKCGPIEDGGSIILDILNSTSDLDVNWDIDEYDGMLSLQSVPIGNYTVLITDENGCQQSQSFTISEEPCVPDPCSNGEIGGTVFYDNNIDGMFQSDIETGSLGVLVELYGCDSNGSSKLLETTYTDPNGDYHFETFYSGEDFKIIFPEVPDGYAHSSSGVDNGTDVIFISANGCENNFALYDLELGCSSPDLELDVAPGEVFSDGTLLGPGIALITCGTIQSLPEGERHTVGLIDIRSVTTGPDRPEVNPDSWWHPSWHVDSIGNVFGVDYDHRNHMYVTPSSHYSNTFGYALNGDLTNYTAAIIKYGDLAGGDENAESGGTIYKLDAETGQASVFCQLPQQAATFTHVGCESQLDPPLERTTGVGLGNIVFDRVNKQFFVSNFEDGKIYRIDTLGNILNNFDPQTLPGFSADDGSIGMASDSKPYGLAVNHTGTSIYFGTHELNEEPGLYSVNLDETGDFTGTEIYHRDFLAEGDIGYLFATEPGWVAISDLDFLPDGRIMIGLKTGCAGNYFTSHNHGATFYIAAANDPDGLYNDNIVNPDIQYPNDGTGNDDGYGGAGIWDKKDGTWDYLVSSSDTKVEAGPHGLIMFPHDFTNGNSGFSLQPSAAIPYIPSFSLNDFKGVGGDVKVSSPCGNAPIHVGNYVWIDSNGDGIQDPCEEPITGMPVKLYEKPTSGDALLVASTVTSFTGEYYFTDNNSPSETWEAGFTEIEEGKEYAIVFCGDNYNDQSEVLTLDEEIYELTLSNSSTAVNDQDDSDVEELNIEGVGNVPAICFTADITNFTFDAGISLKCQMYVDRVSLPEPGGAFAAIIDITWLNGTTTGEFEYQLDSSGIWLPLNRISQASSDSETVEIPLEINSKMITIRFENDTDCFIDVVFLYDLDDPAGFIYCERTGQVLEGGSVDVTPPAGGTWLFVTQNDELLDGSSGQYEWVAVGTPFVPGIYSMTVTPPPGMDLSMVTTPGTPPYGDGDAIMNPDRGGEDNPTSLDSIVLGAYANADSTFILDFTPSSNPFFLDFDLEIDDPFILNNNIPIKNCYCDLALINTIADIPSSPRVGDTIKYEVVIENQGDVDATNIDIKYTIPNGLTYLPINDSANPIWSDDTDCATTTISGVIPGETSDTLCIYLTLENVPTAEVTEDSWTTFAEISAFEDPADPGVDKEDFDSTPDSDPTNDSGGNPEDDTDNETGGDGSGDPEDPTEDMDPTLDEDDHDPAIIYVCDGATIVQTVTEGPFQYFDTVKFEVVVFNQGNGPITEIVVMDHLGIGLEFISTNINIAEGWTGDNDMVTATVTNTLLPGESDTICLELLLVDAIPFDEDAYLQVVEIQSFEDPANPGDPKEDIDSTPDDDPNNDPGGNPDDDTNDETDGEGTGDPTDPTDDMDPTMDEDDNDPELIPIFDLAIDKVVVDNRVYSPGETVDFEINVYNQGNVEAASYQLTDYIRNGFTFSTTGNPGWAKIGDNLVYTSNGAIAPGESETISLTLTVIVPAVVTGVSDWWNYVEISEVDDDTDTGNPDPVDADSTPDNDDENDNPVEPGDDDDDVITENGLVGDDQDDHDPAAVIVGYDLALIKTVTPEGPYEYGDTLTYNVAIHNQGGLVVTNIEVYDSLPCGLLFLEGENPGWELDGSIATTTYEPELAPSESVNLEIKVAIQRCDAPGYDNYFNEAEISDFSDVDGNEPETDDIDSTPDSDPSNDGDPVDNAITDPMDEDDHDPEDIAICDIALINTISEIPSSPKVGDTVKYEVIVYNQGNHDVNSVTVDYDIPNGFSYLPVNDGLTPAWSSATADDADITTAEVLAPGESDTICLYLQIENVGIADVTEDSWTTIAEVTEYTNQDDEVKTTDADSTPDDDPANDPGGNPDDDTDDEIDGEGTGDPNDPTDDMDPTMDEDDHDPAIIYICDIATIIDTEEEGPFSYGDTLKYEVIVYNQGNGDITNVDIQNLFGEGLEFIETASNVAEGWNLEEEGNLGILLTDVLASGETDTICLQMELVPDHESGEDSWLQNVEVVSFEDPANPGDPKEDVDSTPDDDPTNDPGGNPDDETDDETDGEGTGDPNDPNEDMDPTKDEDDQDTEDIDICDLALINTIAKVTDPTNVGDTVKYEVIVVNQGNVGAQSIDIDYLIPNGLTYLPVNNGLSPIWIGESDVLASSTSGSLEPGESDTLCLYLQIENVPTDEVTPDSWTTIAEITEYVDENGDDKVEDVDSTPDDLLINDPGGNPGDDTDDELEGDGTADVNDPTEDMDPTKDEDDNDPAIIYICDVATIIFADIPEEINYYDTLKFNVMVANQGNGDITNITVVDHLPDGLEFIETASNTAEGWEDSETIEGIQVVYDEILGSGETDTICLELQVVPVHEDATDDSWLQEVEISSFEDPANPGDPKEDIDSTPDEDPTNDPGGNPDDDTNDETDGEGTGDPNDPTEDMDPTMDEDDHDPLDIKILDGALIMQIDSMPPVLPVVPGDELKFIVVVTNQGNTTLTDLEITNYLMDENLILSDHKENDDWDPESSTQNVYVLEEPLLPGEVDTVCIYLEVLGGAMSDIVTYSEISGSEETDSGDCYDIDSTPDDILENDAGGEPLTSEDDHVEDDGEDGNEDDITDEDDHDPAMLDAQDLALIVWADHKDPVQEGDDVKFVIRVINQGNITNEKIKVANYIPEGFELSENDTNGWEVANDSTVMKEMPGSLETGDTIETCIILTVQNGVEAEDLINYAEVISSEDPDGLDLTPLDIDSSPNMDPTDDTGGQYEDMPDCSTDPVVINDDNNVEGSGVIGEDEDDHDPAWVHVFDLATIIYTDQTLPVIPGDEVKFVVELYNQGNISAEDIDLLVHIPDGFALSENDNNDWEEEGEDVTLTIEEAIIPEDSSSVCLILEVLPDETLSELIPIIEITGAMDTLGNDQTMNDLDSNPDVNELDDEGGEIFTDSDDELDGNGEEGDDEDDHDPAVPPILDLAINIVTEDELPKIPGDLVKFVITIYNQGSLTPSEFSIENYVPEGLVFMQSENPGWSTSGATDASYTYTDQLLPLTSDTLCLFLLMDTDANPMNVVNMIEISEVIDQNGIDVSLLDIDSEADASNENDLGNDLYSVHDDKLEENGRSGFDEDDHDQAFVLMCGPMACKGALNFSIDESCEGSLTPRMLLTGDIFPDFIYEITIKDENGNEVPNVFGIGDVNKTFEVSIRNPYCYNNSCWLPVTVEYKFPPKIECVESDTLSCVQAFSEASMPSVDNNCVPSELILLGEQLQSLDCDTMFTSMMTRTYIARDEFGNTSDTCTQTIYLERTNLDSISPVLPFAIFNNNALNCSSGYATTEEGYPFPALSVTGAPRLRVEGGGFVDLYPFEASIICNGFAEYKDVIMPGSTSCVTKIRRTFTIGEWWCGGTNDASFTQIIEVVDSDGPEIKCPEDMTVSTGSFDCGAVVSVPLPSALDGCNNDLKIDLGTPVGSFENYNGESFTLSAGVHDLQYAVYDGCGIGSFCSFTVTVVDNADPIAICDQFTEVSLSLETTTYVAAEVIDDGSFDECGDVTLSVARMDDPGFEDFTGFGPQIDIDCDDAGQTVMVGLLVTDAGGNTNMCMVSVDVKDKVDAKMTCPGPMTVDCNFAFDPENLSAFFGEVEIYDNCPGSNEIDEELRGELNSCGSGVLVREITLLNAQGDQVDYCEQVITFESGTSLQYSDITPPDPIVEVDGCGIGSIDPGSLGMPIIPDAVCQQVAIAIENDTFPFTQNGACLKIIRTFKVIDWCISDGPGSALEPFEFIQEIKVSNTVKPIFTEVFEDSTYCSYAIDCGGRIVDGLTAVASDDCTVDSDLLKRYETRNAAGIIVSSGDGHDASGEYDLGSYTVRFIVEDKCGNQEVRESTFSVMSCKQPVPYCLDGLSTTLTAMDTDDDGTADSELVMITPAFFDNGSYHPCGYDVALSFSADIDDTLRVFSCADTVGIVEVPLWVTALDSDGNPLFEMADFCVASLDVQDNESIDLCDGLQVQLDVEGRIYTQSDAELNNAEVRLISSELLVDMTDENGEYGFMNMPEGGYYILEPHKDDDVKNGVSTLDLVMIQRHLLGLAEFDEAYTMIAADINHDDKLTASDLVALRKVILGVNTHFPNNTSWRFVDQDHEFQDETDPWDDSFPESYDIEGLNEDMRIDFVAVKIGDINGNVEANVQAGIISETRSSKTLVMDLPDTEVVQGELYEIDVKSDKTINLHGFQMELALDGVEVIEIKPGLLDVKYNELVIDNHSMKLSYSNGLGDQLEEGDVLYTIVLKANREGHLSEMIEIEDKELSAEAYIGTELNIGKVEISWREDKVASVKKLIAGSVSPNPWRTQSDIHFEMPSSGIVNLVVRDASGKVIFTKEGEFEAGDQSFTITHEDVQISGILLYELQFGDQVIHKKMIRIE